MAGEATATVTVDTDIAIGQTKHLYELTIVIAGNYETNGVAVSAAGVSRFTRVNAQVAGGYAFEWVPSTQKLKVYYSNDDNNADGPLIEVANGAAVTATVLAIAIGA